MGERSKIAWTDHTFNPWWGCVKISPACDHCYAEAFAKRTGHDVWGPHAEYRTFGEKHWAEPLKWDRKARDGGGRHRVFSGSMCDWADKRGPAAERRRLFEMTKATPNLDYLFLTKRPQLMPDYLPEDWGDGYPNVWLGTTVENQEEADRRIPHLLQVPAKVRFLSCEPLLGDVFLPRYGVHWVIAGGESGPRHRPMNLDHARSLRDQCALNGTAFFFKQVGGRTPDAGGHELDGREWRQSPVFEQ